MNAWLDGEERLEGRKDVCGDDGLVGGDGGWERRGAEAGAERDIDKEETKPVVPREWVGREGEGVGAIEV